MSIVVGVITKVKPRRGLAPIDFSVQSETEHLMYRISGFCRPPSTRPVIPTVGTRVELTLDSSMHVRQIREVENV